MSNECEIKIKKIIIVEKFHLNLHVTHISSFRWPPNEMNES